MIFDIDSRVRLKQFGDERHCCQCEHVKADPDGGFGNVCDFGWKCNSGSLSLFKHDNKIYTIIRHNKSYSAFLMSNGGRQRWVYANLVRQIAPIEELAFECDEC